MTNLRYNAGKAQMAFAALLLIQLLLSAWAWAQIPAGQMVPIHWGLSGKADGFAPKGFALSCMPAIMSLLLPLQRSLEHKYGTDQLDKAALVVYIRSLGAAVLLTVAHAIVVFSALGYTVPVSTILPVCIGILLAVLGFTVRKLPGDSKLGVKNPWTAKSEAVAAKTNTFAGYVLMCMGIGAIAAGLADNMPLFAAIVLSGVFVMLAGTCTLSWMLCKNQSK